MQRTFALIGLSLMVSALGACKPPPTDADLARDMPEAAPTYASDPLPSPDTEGAMWAEPARGIKRIIYGIPGEPALVSLECLDGHGPTPSLQITRLSPADEDAGALLALVGNGHIGRVPVDATEVNGRSVWQGKALASDLVWEPFAGPRRLTLTVPGAGMVTLNPSDKPGELVRFCRFGPEQVEGPPLDEEMRERICGVTDCSDRPLPRP